MRWQLTNVEPDIAPGIFVRRFLRYSQTQDGETIPKLDPGDGFTQDLNQLVPIPSAYSGKPGTLLRMPNWYKCVDLSDESGHLNLASFEDSDIRLGRYHWSWGDQTPAAGKPLGSGFWSSVTPVHMDRLSFQIKPNPGENTVLMASYTDREPIMGNLMQSLNPVPKAGADGKVAIWEYESFKDKTSDMHSGDTDDLLTKRKITTATNKVGITTTIPVKNTSFMKGKGPAGWKVKIKRNVKYLGKSASIHVYFKTRVRVTIPTVVKFDSVGQKSTNEGPAATVTMQVKSLYFDDAAKDNDSDDKSIDTFKKVSYSTKKSASPIEVDETWEQHNTFKLKEGKYNTVQFRVYTVAERQGRTESLKGSTDIEARHDLSYLRYAWDEPKLPESK